jgi:hypothetical protein
MDLSRGLGDVYKRQVEIFAERCVHFESVLFKTNL